MNNCECLNNEVKIQRRTANGKTKYFFVNILNALHQCDFSILASYTIQTQRLMLKFSTWIADGYITYNEDVEYTCKHCGRIILDKNKLKTMFTTSQLGGLDSIPNILELLGFKVVLLEMKNLP